MKCKTRFKINPNYDKFRACLAENLKTKIQNQNIQ